MKKSRESVRGTGSLRSQAEARLEKMEPSDPPQDTQRLLHELQVHQIELEIQNEELRQARDEVEAGLAKYADLYDFAPVGYFTFDRSAAILQVNFTGALLLGTDRSRLVKRRFDAFVTDEDRPLFGVYLRDVFAGREQQTCEVLLIREGQPFYVRIEAVAALSGEECRAIVIDISRRKQIEADLKISKERYKELLVNANSIIIRFDQNGTIKFFNECAQEFFGYGLDEVLGKHVKILVPQTESTGKNMEVMVDDIIRNPDGFQENINENILKNGKRVWISWRNKALKDANGQLIGNLAIGNDITEQKRLDEALKISETRFRSLFETARDGIMILHEETGRIVDMNPFLIEMLGYSRETLLGKKLWEIGAFKDVLASKSAFGKLQTNGYVRYEDLPLETKDGRLMSVEFVSNTFRVMDQKVIQCHIRDITERKRMTEALQRSHTEMEQRVAEATSELRVTLSELQLLKDQLEAENFYFREEIKMRHQSGHIIGESDGLKYVLFRAEQVAPMDTTVLILGETGTGKELIAAAIHNMSSRKKRPMITVNCGALPNNLIESELFGREKGAFTGADKRQIGRFEIADGSTICLDEIGELPLEMQAKLLRVIQHHEFERLGSSHTIKVDVRVIATTNRNLEEEVKKGRFREDLFYRLNVFPITVPPLRQRSKDIPLLAQTFIERFARKLGKQFTSVSKETMKALQDYSWPGNIRELQSIMERSVILCQGTVFRLSEKLETLSIPLASTVKTLEETERNQILKTLSENKWRIEGKGGAAEILGIHPSTLRARMHKLGIERPRGQELK
ncbi:MAG: PAS domain S-box protein [Desulfobacteraceae bacterium]|nr:PAS domain S-box protein [Desulfobacteraceae bacterium]